MEIVYISVQLGASNRPVELALRGPSADLSTMQQLMTGSPETSQSCRSEKQHVDGMTAKAAIPAALNRTKFSQEDGVILFFRVTRIGF
jgi:hypothetical protein